MKNSKEYIPLAGVTDKTFPDGLMLDSIQAQTMHSCLGLTTEIAELVDAFKKHIIYGQELDWVNINEELGDAMWYMAILCRISGKSFEDLMQINIDKLKARYPDGFTEYHALNRDLENERSILETKTTGVNESLDKIT